MHIPKWKKPSENIVWFQLKVQWFLGVMRREGKIGRTKYFRDSWTILYDTTMVDTCQYTSAKTHRMCNMTECKKSIGQAKVNYGLWMIMMYQYRFIDCNNYTTLVQYVDSVLGCRFGEAKSTQELWSKFLCT